MAFPSFAEPKLTDLVPTLIDESNFKVWSTSLKWALYSRDEQYHELLIGNWCKPKYANPKRPTSTELEACMKWEDANRFLLPLINATIHPTVRYCIIHTTDARAAYKIIRSIFTIEYHGSGFYEYLELTYIKHTCSGAQDFVDKWRTTLSRLKNAMPNRLPPAFIFYRFLTAVMQEKDGVGALPLSCIPLTPEDFTKRALDSTLERFVAFENDFFNVDNDLELQDY